MATKIADTPDWRTGITTALEQDWRSPWDGQVAPKGSHLTVVSLVALSPTRQLTLPVPNATALMLNASARAAAEALRQRAGSAIDDSSKRQVSFATDGAAFDFLERMIEAVVLAHTGLEAFANESIPDDYVYERFDRSSIILEASTKISVERHVPLSEKLTSILPSIFQRKSPKGKSCWAGYRELSTLRDRVIHMKSLDRRSLYGESKKLWQVIATTRQPHRSAIDMLDHFLKGNALAPRWYQLMQL